MRNPHPRVLGLTAALLAALCVGSCVTQGGTPARDKGPVAKVVKKALPGVVWVHADRLDKHGRPANMVGAGVVVSKEGLVVTCLHVVRDARAVRVTFHDGKARVADVAATDPANDLAVLDPITVVDWPALPLAADPPTPGETVVALGHPYRLKNSVSAGVVSALGRDLEMSETLTLHGLVQTDAASNPGNSGGPLLNLDGEVVGIMAAVHSDGKGLAFAVPASAVKALLAKVPK